MPKNKYDPTGDSKSTNYHTPLIRKLAAILFTDIEGYTALMAKDEALASRLRQRHRQVLHDCHQQHRGEVVNYFGDGTLSIFNSAVDAVRCAIDMQRAFQKDPPVPLRIGIHLGEVVRDKEGLYGNSVNIASRLESFATAGSILVSAKIREELANQRDFSFRSLGLFELKNVPKPVEVFAVANEGVVVPPPTAIKGKGKLLESNVVKQSARLENFVGREKELALLRKAWEETHAARGRMIGIAGEPGIGKTTLIEDFLIELSESELVPRIARGRCSERLAGTEAYMPFFEILENLIQDEESAVLLKQLAPAWYVQLRPYSVEESKMLELSIHAKQERRKREISAFLKCIADRSPLVLFIDDLHWADASSIDLLAYLGPNFLHSSILLLTTYRLADMKLVNHPFLSLKPEFKSKSILVELLLQFLGPKELNDYLDLVFPKNNFKEGLIDIILHRTEGNPLFVTGLLQSLKDQKLIEREKGEWKVKTSMINLKRELPGSVKGMIQKQLNRLEAEDRQLLTIAAVQGYEFDVNVVAEAAERDPLVVADRLQALEEDNRLVKFEGERLFPNGTRTEHYRFVHILYQNVLFDHLRLSRRSLWSQRIAGQLILLYKEGQEGMASELARLYELANEPEKSVEYYLKAARQALAITGYEEVVSLVEKALKLLVLLPQTPWQTEQELELRLILGPALMVIKGFGSPELGENYKKAMQLCSQFEDKHKFFTSMNGIWLYSFNTAELSVPLAIAKEMVAIAEQEADDTFTIVAHHAIADILLFMGELQEAHRHYEIVLDLYDRERHNNISQYFSIEDPALGSYTGGSLGLLQMGYPERAIDWCEKAVRLGRDLPETFSLSLALWVAGNLYGTLREYDIADKYIFELLKLSEKGDSPLIEGAAIILHGWIETVYKRNHKGLEIIEKGLSIYKSAGAHVWPFMYVAISHASHSENRLDEGLASLETCLDLISKINCHSYEPEILRLKGKNLLLRTLAPAGQEAEAHFIKAIQVAKNQQAKWWELCATASLARHWQQKGKHQQAYDKLKAIYDWFTEGFDTVLLKEAKDLLEELATQIQENP